MKVTNKESFVGFGYPRKRGSYKSWIMQDVDDHGINELFAANRWMHICIVYRKKDGLFKVVRVRIIDLMIIVLQITFFINN